MESPYFEQARRRVMAREALQSGIGTLGEKTLHSVLKNYYDSRPQNQEVKVGRYVADILNGDGIIEIQTRSFNTLRKKLSCFLESYPVMVVHPIAHTKWIYWIDPESGEVTKKRKSPKCGQVLDAVGELYKIKPFLTHPNLTFCAALVDLEEYRFLNGWSSDRKKGSTRCERIPTGLWKEVVFNRHYRNMLPQGLPEKFTSKDLSRAAKISMKKAQTALNILHATADVRRVGKQGNAYLYEIEKN